MMPSSPIKSGGAAGLLAGGLFALSAVLFAIAPLEGIVDTGGEYLYQTVVVVAFLCAIIAILGVHAAHRGRTGYGGVGTAGVVLAIAGYAIVAAVTAIGMIRDVEYLLTVRFAGAGLVLAGSALLGVAVLIARLMPWWCGVLLIVAFPLGDFANVLFPTAENVLLALLWGSIGYTLLALPDRAREPGATQTATLR
jgi:hypothetical protein